MITRNILFAVLLINLLTGNGKTILKGQEFYYSALEDNGFPEIELWVDGNKRTVHTTSKNTFTSIPISRSPIRIKVYFNQQVDTAVVRPLADNIIPEVSGDTVIFTINKPCKISVEVNHNIWNPMLLFVQRKEQAKPSPNDPDVTYFKGGKTYRMGRIDLDDNEILYIEDGAIVEGTVRAEGKQNIKIMGRGILYAPDNSNAIRLKNCQNVRISGITVVNKLHWTVFLIKTDHVRIQDLNVNGIGCCSDGIDIVASQRVEVSNCFVRSGDDCVVLKAKQRKYLDGGNRPVDQVAVLNCVLWNGSLGSGAIEIGFETQAEYIANVLYHDCDIIHVEGYAGAFTIHNGDRATVENITFKDIRVEDARGYLFDFKILDAQYTRDEEKGHIQNIHCENVSVVDGLFPNSLFVGFDDQHIIKDITFKNIEIHSKKVNSPFDGSFYMEKTKNIKFQ